MGIKKDSLLASIDIGTNTIRLLVAEVKANGEIRELYSERRITRIGEGMAKGRILNPKAIERTVAALKIFKEAADRYPLEGRRAVATHAVREASNKKEFLTMAKKEAGLAIDVITGREEAKLTLLGVFSGIKKRPQYSLIMDVGGGSTEFILSEGNKSKVLLSMNFGVVPLAEAFVKDDHVNERDIRNMKGDIRERIEEARQRIKKSLPVKRGRKAGNFWPEGTILIGTAGTITTLAAVDQGLERYSSSRINNYMMKRSSVERIYQRLKAMSAEDRRGIPAIEPGREDLILPGSLILIEAMKDFDFREILVSDYGLREGIIIDLQKRLLRN